MKAKKIIIAILIGVLFALGVIATTFIKNRTYRLKENSYFLNYNLENMTHKEVQEYVQNKINPQFDKVKIKIKVNGHIYSMHPSQINAHFNHNDIFNIAKKRKNDKEIPEVKYDKNKLKKFVKELAEKTKINPTKFKYKKYKNKLMVKAGSAGKEILIDDLIEKIDDSLQNLNFKTITPNFKEIESEESIINLEKIKKEIEVEVKDASFKLANGKRVYENEIVGIYLDLNEAKKIVKDPKRGIYTLYPHTTQPNVTVAGLQKEHNNPHTPNVLSSFSTNLSAKANNVLDQNRKRNVEIAAAATNGKILLPGEEFSFKDTAGKASGYLEAVTYSQGKKTKGIGGGICQVSSTLFNAALMANMQITQRKSHSRPVGYVAVGRDATYDNSGPDFRFINTRKFPVRIQTNCSNNTLTATIVGTQTPEENYHVAISSKVVSEVNHIRKAVTNVTVTLNGQVVKNTRSFDSSYNTTPAT